MDHKSFLSGVDPATRAELTARNDRAGLRHLAGHAGLIVVLGVYIASGWPLWPLAMLPLGVSLAFLFTLQHECTHRTPFRSGWLNEALGHATGLILVQPFEWFRVFHMAHHRHTNDPERDPELQGQRPDTRPGFLWHLSTLGYWRMKIRTLLRNAAGRDDAAYVNDRIRPRIGREARVMLGLYALAALFTLFVSNILLWVWIVPLALGFPVLRLYLLAEHGRCPPVADMFDNTRTTLTNRIVRFLAWNMPYHAEHHAWPTVPFHHLPRLHRMVAAHLKHVSPGYGTFTRGYVAALDAADPIQG